MSECGRRSRSVLPAAGMTGCGWLMQATRQSFVHIPPAPTGMGPSFDPLQGKLLASDSFPGQDRTKLCMASKVGAHIQALSVFMHSGTAG